jgi:HTH-type transcriptional regulator/antitoxin HipB
LALQPLHSAVKIHRSSIFFGLPHGVGELVGAGQPAFEPGCVLSELAPIQAMNALARDPKQIGNGIRRARRRGALSQQAPGDGAGLRQETISLIENGQPAAKLETLLVVLAALDLEFQIAPRSKSRRGGESYF